MFAIEMIFAILVLVLIGCVGTMFAPRTTWYITDVWFDENGDEVIEKYTIVEYY